MKSKIVFDKNCNYVLTAIENNFQKDVFVKGLKVYAEVIDISVSENLVLLRSIQINGKKVIRYFSWKTCTN